MIGDMLTLQTKRIITAAAAVFLLCIFFSCIHYSLPVQAYMNQSSASVECFTSIQVKSGESLWSISERYYSKEYKNREQYMQKIRYINHMTSDEIHEGAYLIVPYYTVPESADTITEN